ncbi:MAG TPA: DEAD/DEAH box helicase [Chlamydiales bacterium]|nr:DEAD/DEAH box helicase [Chlamydiales bacterium]
MLNFRKIKQDFASSVLKEGRQLFDEKKVLKAKISRLDADTVHIHSKIQGNFENTYECEIEIDRLESEVLDSNCDCTYQYDCRHLAALIFHLERYYEDLLVEYSHEADIHEDDSIEEEEKELILETLNDAKTKHLEKKDAAYQKEVLSEYVQVSEFLATSPFFLPKEEKKFLQSEIAIVLNPESFESDLVEFQLVLRVPTRSKPLFVPNVFDFIRALQYEEPIVIAAKRYFFSLQSFDDIGRIIVSKIAEHARYNEAKKNDRMQRFGNLNKEVVGGLLGEIYDTFTKNRKGRSFSNDREDLPAMQGVFLGSLEVPMQCSFAGAGIRLNLNYIAPPSTKIMIDPYLSIDQDLVSLKEAILFECAYPGMVFDNVYYHFPSHVQRIHLNHLKKIEDLIIPEPLFGTFVENSLPELKRFATIGNQEIIENFVTIPYPSRTEARCSLSYLDGELEATLFFSYDDLEVNSSSKSLSYQDAVSFISEEGILARNLVEERKVIEELFQDFIFNPETGTYLAKSERKIVEFMTEIIPAYQDRISFECPQNLLDQFIYDDSKFKLELSYDGKVGYYTLNMVVDGSLKGVSLDLLWDCILSKRSYIELASSKKNDRKKSQSKFSKILVLDLEVISKVIQIFDEIGVQKIDNHKEDKPLWSLVSIEEDTFKDLPVEFSITDELVNIRRQMIGETPLKNSVIPASLKKWLRPYQKEGVDWLEKLRFMYLNGILADDMGLGKTLQAISAMTQFHKHNPKSLSIVVCPTSLLYNWKEEINKFNPKINVQVIDGTPQQRKKMIESSCEYDVFVTSYTLLQKDIEHYEENVFGYVILDEAQHIKNRATRNAKSVKKIKAQHRLILTGTPIENSLDELWSLFDFLMPGFLSSYDRFVEKYVRKTSEDHQEKMHKLKKKVSPFILRRMKGDVLKDLPPVSEMVYRCQLGTQQQELYKTYAQEAKDELVKLVEKEGFDKVQIHVLATLTRLKQICCHPAIFAKEKAEAGDSAKYDMLLELLDTLIEGGHKTVIFSQYTKMLHIMRDDFEQRGIRFSYLDGTTKNRLEVVKEFNETKEIPVFLVSLKAGGTGLNITGADTVIHYDMWWNPAVESQATDRVHRLGQTKAVSTYKLVTLGSIEEKIVQMQNRKKGLVKKVVSCDDEAVNKLTWEDVLELLQT